MPTVFSRTPQASIGAVTTAKIRELMLGIAAHPITLYEIVAAGPLVFRNRFLAEFRGFAVDDHIANLVFKFFCEQVMKRHPGVAPTPGLTAGTLLDAVEVPSPPTEAEIERAWVHEVFSSEDGRVTHYKDGAGMAGQNHPVIIRN